MQLKYLATSSGLFMVLCIFGIAALLSYSMKVEPMLVIKELKKWGRRDMDNEKNTFSSFRDTSPGDHPGDQPGDQLNNESGTIKYVDAVSAAKPHTLKLLSWNSRKPGHEVPWFKLGSESFKDCLHKCSYSDDKKTWRTSHVILFRGTLLSKTIPGENSWASKNLPLPRLPDQKWLFLEMESPAGTRYIHPNFRHLFNATSTYKRDADVRYAYGECEKLPAPKAQTSTGMAKGRSKLVAWFVSNCYTMSRRELYIRELSNYIPITVEGRCGADSVCSRTDHDCSTRLKKQHKFYLSFENGLCNDYYTEKLINALVDRVVPIVYGLVDYANILPPKSYIDVRDFRSPRHLADYLKKVDRNDTLYDEYFAWKQTHRCFLGSRRFNCRLCEYFHNHYKERQVVDLKQVWTKETNCLEAEEFHKKFQSFEGFYD